MNSSWIRREGSFLINRQIFWCSSNRIAKNRTFLLNENIYIRGYKTNLLRLSILRLYLDYFHSTQAFIVSRWKSTLIYLKKFPRLNRLSVAVFRNKIDYLRRSYAIFSTLQTGLSSQQEWSVPTAGLPCKKASLLSVGVVATWYVTSSLNSVEIILWDFFELYYRWLGIALNLRRILFYVKFHQIIYRFSQA